MRIVAGRHKGRKLAGFEGDKIRPTSDKVRLALFNMLHSRGAVVDTVVIDAFCGTGALSLEALSQGAKSAVLIDADRASLNLAKENAATLKETENCVFFLADATKLPRRSSHEKAADLCFLDPPYRKGLVPIALQSLKENGWLADGCWIVAEMERDAMIDGLNEVSEKIYGETKIILGKID